MKQIIPWMESESEDELVEGLVLLAQLAAESEVQANRTLKMKINSGV